MKDIGDGRFWGSTIFSKGGIMGEEMSYKNVLQIAVILGLGFLIFLWMKIYLEPWVIETTCRELLKCDQ